jgi:hypothetical protein
VVLEIEATAATVLTLDLSEPVAQSSSVTLPDLHAGSHHLFTGGFPKEGYQWHRLLPLAASSLHGRCMLPVQGRSHIYLRARQRNGHIAWASPVFINHR